MYNLILDTFTKTLENAGISAMRSYPAKKLDRYAEAVCIGMKEAELLPTAMGDYLGTETVSGEVRELYGFRLRLSVYFDVYVPANGNASARCLELAEKIRSAIYAADILFNIDCFSCGDVSPFSELGMFKCRCELCGVAYPTKSFDSDTVSLSDLALKGEPQ